jgi:tRNA 2-thiouridine synthesizing protein C
VPEAKSLLFVLTSAPHGRVNAQEGLDALLMGSAFADCSALFLGDGILQLIAEQDTTRSNQKNFSRTFGALKDYGVNKIFCSETQLSAFGLDISNLVIEVTPLSNQQVCSLLSADNVILNF